MTKRLVNTECERERFHIAAGYDVQVSLVKIFTAMPGCLLMRFCLRGRLSRLDLAF